MEKNKDIFTIGDNTNYGIIKRFEKSGDMIRVYFEDKPINYHVNLKVLEHSKQPLFTTEDGVEIFEGDWYQYLHKHSWNISTARANKDFYEQDKYSDNSLYFSTKEKAQEYTDLHKPCLSINDVINQYERHSDWKSKEFKEELIKLINGRSI